MLERLLQWYFWAGIRGAEDPGPSASAASSLTRPPAAGERASDFAFIVYSYPTLINATYLNQFKNTVYCGIWSCHLFEILYSMDISAFKIISV